MAEWQEACGVFGFYDMDGFNTAEMVYYGLFALQHRGQESCGIAVNDNGKIIYHKEKGLLGEVFDKTVLSHLDGKMGIGHVRYGAGGSNQREDAQPLVAKYTKGHMAIAHNGQLVNGKALREEFERAGSIFQSNSDAEVVAALLSRHRVKNRTLEDALAETMRTIKGAYALVLMTPHKIIAARDPLGMRPLVIGKKANSYIIASETSALTAVGASYVRDVRPGEIVVVNGDGLRSMVTDVPHKTALCLFEFIYFARPDSDIDGASVYQARFEAGRQLAREYQIDADIVIGVPDSGLIAAMGYANYSKVPYADGLLKNRYIGRTFIQPSQAMREQSVVMKLSPIRSQIEGKRVIMIDDSIVRGTTSKIIVKILKDAGAKAVHMLSCSPPVKYPCHFGIDTSEKETLIANTHTMDEIRKAIGADSLGFLSLEGLVQTPKGAKSNFCKACFDGRYPIAIEEA